ncbi:MAG: hypothetical protein HC906_03725 [Bacteroidales bacterium]|nr:hypothetical protein [Bacteroidales bacterium]
MKVKRCSTAILLFFYLTHCISQKYNFRNYSVNDGLTQSEIYAICQDRQGNMWFGTEGGGLVKFDGYAFKSYREEDGLSNSFVRVIFEDKTGILWIGTEEGVNSFDGAKFLFHSDPAGPGKSSIKCIIQDSSSDIWIGTENNGLFKYNKGRFTKFSAKNGLSHNTVFCLLETADSLLIGTKKGVTVYKDSKFLSIPFDDLRQSVIRSMVTDNTNRIWFATQGNGAFCLTDSSLIHYNTSEGLTNPIIYCALNDNRGSVWFGTANGVSRFKDDQFRNYSNKNGLPGDVIVSMYYDTFGNIWFGTSGGGITRFDNERFVHYTENELIGKQVYSVIQAPNKNMLFGTSAGGISVFDGIKTSLLKGISGFTNSKIRCLFYSNDSNLWIGTFEDGIYLFDNSGFQHFTINNGLVSNHISGITSDTSGNIWIASSDSGVCVFYPTFQTIMRYPDLNLTGEKYSIHCIGQIWKYLDG